MTKQDAGEALNLHPRRWVPLLSKWPAVNRVPVVPVAAVDALYEEFVNPSELAYLLEVDPKKAISIAGRHGLERNYPAGFVRSDVVLLFGKQRAPTNQE